MCIRDSSPFQLPTVRKNRGPSSYVIDIVFGCCAPTEHYHPFLNPFATNEEPNKGSHSGEITSTSQHKSTAKDMSYQPASNPPAYTDDPNAPPLHDPLADDFKYDTVVSGCELSIRQQFIRKVYTLLFLQLLLTTGLGALISMNDAAKSFALNNTWLFFVSIFGSFACLIGAFIQSKKYPVNLVLLGLFTLFEGYTIGVATSLYDSGIVIEALVITLVIFVGLTAFAFQSKYDFTSWAGVLNSCLFALIGIGFIQIFFTPSNTMELVYSGIGAIVFSGYILVDTQLIMRKFNIEEEIPAAITLYLDIINLFLNILRILSSSSNDN